MPFLSPAKLLVVLVVAVVVLGPEKLPKAAKQIGSLWGDLRRLRERLESDVRATVPGLPSTERIHQAVRAPLSFLDELAGTGPEIAVDAGPPPPADAGPPPPAGADPPPATSPPGRAGDGRLAYDATTDGRPTGTGPREPVHRVLTDDTAGHDVASLN